MSTKSDYTKWHRTLCPYCGVGCGLKVAVKNNRVVKVLGDENHPSSWGKLCAKPIYLPDTLRTEDRLLYPQVRTHQDTPFQQSTWDQAINYAAVKFQEIIDKHGSDAVAFYGSGQFSTEDYYVSNKLAKGFIGTNNFDANSRLCMASAVVGYKNALGSDGPPPAYKDIDLADCFFLIGTNTAACHPIVFNRIKKRKKENPDTVVIVVDPRETRTAKIADIYLPVRPGSDVPLLNAMMHVLIHEGYLDSNFIVKHTDNFEAIRNLTAIYPPSAAAKLCDVPEELIVKAARAFGRAKGALSFWSMGVNQSTVGVAKNYGIINLHLATGKIGKPGNGPFSLTGQPNAMGGREAGGLSHLLPGYRLVSNEEDRAELAGYWDVPLENINPKPGKPTIEMFEAAARGEIKALWIACTNPMVSMPNIDVVEAALRRAELVIVQDAYHPTDTSHFAHVLFPAAQWSEKEGVMTNSERRITYLPKLVDPPGEALPDWEIFARFGRAMGYEKAFSFKDAAHVFDEFVWLTSGRVCNYSGVSHQRLQKEGPLQWPVPTVTDPGSERLYTDNHFPTDNGRSKFFPPLHKEPDEEPDETYPFVLTTGRLPTQWHTMTRTGKSAQLMKGNEEPFVEIHPADAAEQGIEDGQMIKVDSRRGTAVVQAIITDRVRQGTIFIPFHWGRLSGHNKAANNLTTDAVDPISKEPEFKACAVNMIPIKLPQLEDLDAMPVPVNGNRSRQLPLAAD